MRTLNISISDVEYKQFGITTQQLTFTSLIDLVSKKLMQQNLNHCVALAEKYGLSTMTAEEISDEVKAVRRQRCKK
ncbi:MAG: hypothetical protein LBF69_01590 [Prevotellaceae bacterium]|jgi:DNA-binding FrmR family transcriptional regulator|nr:hypothetical protein [Prevotellaceae bacterium]